MRANACVVATTTKRSSKSQSEATNVTLDIVFLNQNYTRNGILACSAPTEFVCQSGENNIFEFREL